MTRRPSKKYRRRERREAARHGLTLEQLRSGDHEPPRRKTEPVDLHAAWRNANTS